MNNYCSRWTNENSYIYKLKVNTKVYVLYTCVLINKWYVYFKQYSVHYLIDQLIDQ